ncbi:MAG: TonB-dependent receptor, partial [Parvularculaceae bacterium]|nr:TonB-dependent receptor [Parvularculaceae bacterium]
GFAIASAFAATAALAQDAPPPAGAVGAFSDEVLVTAQKKANAEDVQDVPLAVTAYGDAQLDALKVRDVQNLSYSVPNVQFEDIGTAKGVANFSIRGLGVNSSIPSIDPAVGTFMDGVYLGTNAGVVMDIFDLESVEILRGPQGILFGRNVTGGAVLINTKKPNLEKFEGSFKGSVDSGFRGTGNNYTVMGAVSAPIIKDTLGFRLTAYYNNDRGWHKRYLGGPNLVNRVLAVGGTNALIQTGSPLIGGVARPIAVNQPDAFVNFGKSETWSIKPQLLWRPTDAVELRLQYQRFHSEGDGPAAQNHSGFVPGYTTAGGAIVDPQPSTNTYFSAPKDSFIFSINEPGFYKQKLDAVTAELNIEVGNGVITNVFGWRDFTSDTYGDIDATPMWLFHSGARTEFSQISNELRYAANWLNDRLQTTVGFYYYSSDLGYDEYRYLLGGFSNRWGGGNVDARNYGVFGQIDFKLTDALSLIGGARYTNEKKDAQVANIITRAAACSAITATCPFNLVDSFTWKNVTPKVGLQWQPRNDFQAYASWTQGVRSGGYNVRHTAPVIPNARFDDETVDTYEIGFKAQPADGRAVVNFAIFRSDISNMQRELNLTDAAAGVVQLIRNTADARIFGMEIEARYRILDNLIFTGNIGRLDGDYQRVLFNLNSDFRDLVTGTAATTGSQQAGDPDIIDSRDLQLQIPRLAPWTYGMGLIHTLPVGTLGTIDTRFSYSHRDANAYTDNNLGILKKADIFDATISLTMDRATVSLYGQNLSNEVTHGGETQLPLSLGGGSFAPLNKGRVIGLELQLKL